MERFSKVAVLDNEVEGGLLESILNTREIPHMVRSYHDAALDGIFQMQKGWGCVLADESNKAEILSILGEIRAEASAG